VSIIIRFSKPKKGRSVYRIHSESKRTFEMYDMDQNGKEFRNLEIVYTRK
jgi:hypothetical protein